ncbi:restriction endonuclease subunit S [Fructilactobacillus ixorae]|uniref:Restriction endonuclease subunit S n=1 Tax=Fructilactobacillus ixorae TaxID=1750535 RepID=A0ABY5C686_9LACO|nr:restriction endonuclease subunit S [Fructilactobacillus ixorae]USS93108.1 restriction endonuclease subunit S [Fructilactobacillus ixorae]
MKNVPEIRFQEFSAPWEQQQLSQVTVNLDVKRIPIAKSKRIPGTTPYYGANGIQDYVQGFTHQGKFILIAEDGARDVNDYPIQLVSYRIWVNNHTHVLAPKETVDWWFIGMSLHKVNMRPYLTGTGRVKLTKADLQRITITMPTRAEQTKIGAFFQTFTQLITVKQRKLAKLRQLKKALQRHLFPAPGQLTPGFRFANFADNWQQRKHHFSCKNLKVTKKHQNHNLVLSS